MKKEVWSESERTHKKTGQDMLYSASVDSLKGLIKKCIKEEKYEEAGEFQRELDRRSLTFEQAIEKIHYLQIMLEHKEEEIEELKKQCNIK